MARYAKTIDELAEAIGVSRQTVIEWKRKSDFPAATTRGWNIDKVDRWCNSSNRGPYRKNRATGDRDEEAGEAGAITLHEANRLKTVAQAESERIKAENAAIEQAKIFETILDADDVQSIFRQMVATVKACIDGSTTAVDRALPESRPSEKAWPDIRKRVVAIAIKLESDVSTAMEALW